jgi:ABC-type bacteriocin/lantibiotic exporter with double-glycine peptidase domain
LAVRSCCIFLLWFSIAVADSGIWLDIPFVKQTPAGCGAACISMVMQYWVRISTSDNLAPAVFDSQKIMLLLYSKQAGGILASDMQRYFDEHGFRTFVFEGNRADLQNHLQKGRPLIVCLDTNGKRKILHYVVVAGIRPDDQMILLNDPDDKKLASMEWPTFEKEWKAMRNWTLLAVPKNAP